RINAGVVAVAEDDADGVVADRLQVRDRHVLFARDRDLLARAVAHHLGRGRMDAQEFRRELVGLAVVEIDLDEIVLAAHADRFGQRAVVMLVIRARAMFVMVMAAVRMPVPLVMRVIMAMVVPMLVVVVRMAVTIVRMIMPVVVVAVAMVVPVIVAVLMAVVV